MEAPRPGHGDTAARVPDHRSRDLQHQAAAESGAPQARSIALGSEHLVDEIERQLSGLKLSQDVKTSLDQNDEMPPL